MKALVALVSAVLWSAAVGAQPWIIHGAPMERDYEEEARQREYGVRAARRAALNGKEYREVEGVTNSIYGRDWFQFQGKVMQVQDGGVRVRGKLCRADGKDVVDSEFFVVHCPFVVSDDDVIKGDGYHMAKLVGSYTYATVGGTFRTLKKLDYGRVVQWYAEVASPGAQADRVARQAVAVFEFYRAGAEGGDTYSEFRVGELYRDGKGVGRDLRKACVWFRRAAAQGHREAGAALADCEATSGGKD